MIKNKAVMIIITILVIAIVFVIVYCFSKPNNEDNEVDMSGIATVNNPVISPSGKYQLKVIDEMIDGIKHNKFAIYKVSNGEIESSAIFISNDVYRTRDALFFLWDDKDRVWVYSGDVGVFFWESVSDGIWQKHDHADNKSIPVPTLLEKLRPGIYGSN